MSGRVRRPSGTRWLRQHTCSHRVPVGRLRLGVPAEGTEEGPQALGYNPWLLPFEEVASTVGGRPVRNRASPLDPGPGRRKHVPIRHEVSDGHRRGLPAGRIPERLVVETHGRRDGLGDPIDGEVREEGVTVDRVLHETVVVGPASELLTDPGGETGWAVVQCGTEGLRLVGVHLQISHLVRVPLLGIGDESALLAGQILG